MTSESSTRRATNKVCFEGPRGKKLHASRCAMLWHGVLCIDKSVLALVDVCAAFSTVPYLLLLVTVLTAATKAPEACLC